jgi:hypothetical protein
MADLDALFAFAGVVAQLSLFSIQPWTGAL